MDKISEFAKKYRQAPWRTQRQWLGLILLGVVVIAMVSGIYLSVSNKATTYGTEIFDLNSLIADNQRKNADYQTQISELNSAINMQERADALDFESVEPGDIVYVVVPGYSPESDTNLPTGTEELPQSIILPEYKETLVDWFAEWIQPTVQPAGGDQ